ncbi:hypothetical protein [Streptomyces sp. NBC_00623]|uniref:hypothetical protein n=1 Tax=Streptomyces sp. NBC_00623 TaxID=2975790 RepID=UPI0030E4410B
MSMQEALGGANAAGEANTTAAPTVPRQATAEPPQSKPKKAAATSVKATASKKSAAKTPSAKASSPKAPSAKASSAKASSAKAPKTDTKPTLVNLIRGHLEQQSEPRSATEVAALTKAHPDHGVKTTVVRTTLEGLVAKSQAQRTKQGSSVFYTAAAASEAAAADSQQEAVAGWPAAGAPIPPPPGRSLMAPRPEPGPLLSPSTVPGCCLPTVHTRDATLAGAVCGQEERGSGHDVASAPSS